MFRINVLLPPVPVAAPCKAETHYINELYRKKMELKKKEKTKKFDDKSKQHNNQD